MYAYNFKPKQKAINFKEIFVVMPFGSKYDDIYEKLIVPATEKANGILSYSGSQRLLPYRSKDDIRTTSGWINVLEHLLTAQIVLGVLTDNNPNVFYELGIAHATEPITRQILVAPKQYERQFDLKDLIYYEYEDELDKSIDPLASRIADAIKSYNIDEEKKINQARMLIGPYEFEVLMTQGSKRNFVLHTSVKGREDYEKELLARLGEEHLKGAFERHVPAIANLCSHGFLGLHTSSERKDDKTVVHFSYHWTELGNSLLYFMKLIPIEELRARRDGMPAYFD
ncbi:MAG: hypothetical protein Q8R38_00580 [Candidatus Omnitrophota bacterium]|nr:hypothetical protein [Candidatus Omnitrophota bacterium]